MRDAAVDFRPAANTVDHIAQEYGVRCLAIVPVENCREFRSAARRTTAMEKLRSGLEEGLAKAWPRGAATPSLEELTSIHSMLAENILERLRVDGNSFGAGLGVFESRWNLQSASPGMLLPPGAAPTRGSVLGDKFVTLLGQAYSTGATVSVI